MSGPDLGHRLSHHRASRAGLAKALAIMFSTALAGAILIGVAVAGGPGDFGGRVILSLLGLLFFLPLGLGTPGLRRNRDNSLGIYERGLVVHEAGVDRSIAWDEVASFTDGSLGILRIETQGGEEVVQTLDSISERQVIFARLRDEVVLRRLVPRLKAALLGGQSVDLGAEGDTGSSDPEVTQVPGFTLSATGITASDALGPISWSEISACEPAPVSRGAGKLVSTTPGVLIRTRHGAFRTAVESTSEGETLVALCSEMRSASRPPP
jgi:hypothetical protein